MEMKIISSMGHLKCIVHVPCIPFPNHCYVWTCWKQRWLPSVTYFKFPREWNLLSTHQYIIETIPIYTYIYEILSYTRGILQKLCLNQRWLPSTVLDVLNAIWSDIYWPYINLYNKTILTSTLKNSKQGMRHSTIAMHEIKDDCHSPLSIIMSTTCLAYINIYDKSNNWTYLWAQDYIWSKY